MRTAWRGRFAQLLLWAGLLGIAVQLIRVQVDQAPALQAEARQQSVHRVEVPAIRGAVLDRNGSPLAVSTPVKSVYAVPEKVRGGEKRLRRLADALDLTYGELRDRLERDTPFTYLKRQVPPRVAEAAEGVGLPGVGTLKEFRRYYPDGEVAAHVVGFVGVDSNGLEGVELAYDQSLGGDPGRRLVERDALGRDLRTLRVLEPVEPGKPIRLSLDGRLQYVAYQALKETVVRQQARAGMAVVLDPRTGEVLALANVPSYNPNSLARSDPHQRRNRAVTDAMEPGSIFKPFTVAAALEEDQVRPETIVHGEDGYMRVGGHGIHDAHPMGKLTVRQVIQKSSNIGAAKIAMEQENGDLWRHLRDFGFGLKPGTGFPGETRGILHLPHEWQRFDRATLGFGHGVATSALQMARAYAVLANQGVRMPLTLRRLEKGEGRDGKRILSRETARQVSRMLGMVVSEEGTGGRAAVKGYRVAGKTGTAQKPGPDGYREGEYVASFAGFAPLNDPRLVTVVMIDEPHKDHYGGVVAAPVFRRIMAQGLRYMQVPPRPRMAPDRLPRPLRQAREGGPEEPRT
jgi:cell division protein FtsI (penicillin-binding protein 3)